MATPHFGLLAWPQSTEWAPYRDLLVAADELERRRAGWKPLEPRYTTGVLGKYAKLVGSAAQGAITG